VAEETGARVGRASLRLRSPTNKPAPWVEGWLRTHEGALATAALPLREIVEDEEGARARVILPIAIEPLCLSCHGEAEGIDREIRAMLADRYPHDAATGYAVGDLRGALWAEAPVRLSSDDP